MESPPNNALHVITFVFFHPSPVGIDDLTQKMAELASKIADYDPNITIDYTVTPREEAENG